MERKKYLVIFDVNTGEWVNSVAELTRTLVFEAGNDDEALGIVASYAKGKKKCDLMLLVSITKGIEFEKIDAKNMVKQLTDVVAELTDDRLKQAKLERLQTGEGILSQLQPSEL